jgi:peptidoglycan/xylan/chitin deacetylase (PgdA/CDA1 family)
MEPRRYGPFAYVPINRRKKLAWPDGKRVALVVVPNIETFALDEKMPAGPGGSGGLVPDVNTWSHRDYGSRIGIFRIMDVLTSHGIRATAALNSDTCDLYPEIIEDAVALGWEIMGHNESNTRRLNTVAPEKERGLIKATLDRIAKATGKRPEGWLSAGMQETWNTLDHLAAEGCSYVADWVNDDQPYLMQVGNGRLVALPYSVEANDRRAYEYYHLTPEEFAALLIRQFDVLYREGAHQARVMTIALHPFLSGAPHRIDSLEFALAHITKHEGVWRATGSEVVAHFLRQQDERP